MVALLLSLSAMGLFRRRRPAEASATAPVGDACPTCGADLVDDPDFCHECLNPARFDDIEELDFGW